MMIDALIYGEIPINTIERLLALPPVNILNAPSRSLLLNTEFKASRSAPGTEICDTTL